MDFQPDYCFVFFAIHRSYPFRPRAVPRLNAPERS